MFCFMIRKKISAACERDRTLPGRLEKHIRQCAACRRHRQQTERLHQALGSAARTDSALPPFAHGRIMTALKAEKKPVASWNTLRTRTAGALTALALVGIGLWAVRSGRAPALADEGGSWGNLTSLEAGAMQVENLIGQGPDALAQPLRTEILYLQGDLMAVAEKFDSYLNGAIFAVIMPGNG